MNIEISVDYEAGEIYITLDDHILLNARKDDDGTIVYGRGFDNLTDDAYFLTIKDIVRSISKNLLT